MAEWFKVSCEQFNGNERAAIMGEFVVRASDDIDAQAGVERYLKEPVGRELIDGQWVDKPMSAVLDLPDARMCNTVPLNTEENAYYHAVPGDHVRLVAYVALQNAD